MIRRAAAVLVALSTAASSVAAQTDAFWALDAQLPMSPRMEMRTLRSNDPEAAEAAIRVWMEEHHAAQSGPPGGQSWVVPAADLRELDEMLSGYGRVSRRSVRFANPPVYGGRSAPAASAMLDPRQVVARRDRLQKELDALAARPRDVPAITQLASAFATTLDRLAQARERYDSAYLVDISFDARPAMPREMVPGPHGTIYLETSVTAPPLLPARYSQEPGAPRVPQLDDREGDYLSWQPVAANLEDAATAKVSVLADEPEAAFKRLDGALKALQRESSPMKTLPTSSGVRNVVVQGVLYPALPLTAYLIAKEDMEKARAIVKSSGRVAEWEPRKPSDNDAFRLVPPWHAALLRELRAQKDALAPYPEIRSLVLDQTRRLSPYANLYSASPTLELVAVEVLGKQGTTPMAPVVPGPGAAKTYLPP